MNKESCNQEKISEKTSQELLTRIEATKSLVFGLLTACEALSNDQNFESEDISQDNSITPAGNLFIVDKTILLATFGNCLSEEFGNLIHYLKELKTFRDLN